MVFRYSNAVQSANCNVTRINVGWFYSKSFKLDPALEEVLFFRSGPSFLLRRHEPGARIIQDLEPQIVIGRNVDIRPKLIKSYFPFLHSIHVTVGTIFREERLNGLMEVSGRGILGGWGMEGETGQEQTYRKSMYTYK